MEHSMDTGLIGGAVRHLGCSGDFGWIPNPTRQSGDHEGL